VVARRWPPDHEVDDGADHAGEHDYEYPDELVPSLEHRIVRHLDYIDDGPDPEGEGRDTDGEEDEYEESVPCHVDLPTRVCSDAYPTGVGEGGSYPSERERAVRASLLGTALGLILALFARRRKG
jgi:hypothetical protein